MQSLERAHEPACMEARGHEAIDSSDRGNVSQPFSTLSFFQGHVNQDISARKEKTAVHRYIVREHHTQVLHPNKMEERKLKPIYGKFHLIRHSGDVSSLTALSRRTRARPREERPRRD
jgi:hypothetical protein